MSHPDDGLLQELLDGELAPADEAVVRAHLAGCAPCTTVLAELKAAQVEADGIVARLDLDPPLPMRRARPVRRARPDLRMLGLAAGVMLVAGTSWLLFRSTPPAQPSERADSGSGIVLPVPATEREEVAAGGPAASPPAEVAERKAMARPGSSGTASRPQARKEDGGAVAEKDVASAALPLANAVAAKDAPSPPLTIADAEARFGGRLLTIAGLTPLEVQMVPAAPDAGPRVRQTYVVDGVPVVLVQQRTPARPAPGALVSQDEMRSTVTAKQRAAEPVGMAAAGAPLRLRYWRSGDVVLELEGALPADSLDALMRRVK